MRYLSDQIKKMQGFDSNNILKTVIEEGLNSAFIANLVKTRLRETGTRADKSKIVTFGGEGAGTGSYSTATIKEKKKKGQEYKHVTLKDTGDFHDSFIINTGKDRFHVEGDEDKPEGKISDNLEFDGILDISEEELQELINFINDKYVLAAKKAVL